MIKNIVSANKQAENLPDYDFTLKMARTIYLLIKYKTTKKNLYLLGPVKQKKIISNQFFLSFKKSFRDAHLKRSPVVRVKKY